ncbi:DUF1672 domain-containing protein [Rossellomorea marisflavi]|uniref:DUF1672 domain-containing protein n=1 Tax=Rossellomorea marisflavi TaxID=189381 RepID=UPI00279E68FC|nr:DUF1672 domain-containing protein [Rossellomorea marisflavi]UTE71807.1 DUF1672 domain-containing protein [Rossellomorea marisflavi]
MTRKRKLLLCTTSVSFLLGGCLGMDSEQTNTNQDGLDRPKDIYESVLTYTGDGYDLPGGEKNEAFAKEHEDEVVKATKDFLKKEYNIDVKVHNIVGNKDGVTVFYESTGRIHFYATAIVPIDVRNEKVLADSVWTLEGEVEDAIRGGLYGYIMADEFKELDELMVGFTEDFPIVGRTQESLENVRARGYTTPYYFTQSIDLDEAINPVYDLYIRNPDTPKDQLKAAYASEKFNPRYYRVAIQFFMEDPDAQPSQEIVDSLVKALEENENIPNGSYSVHLNDHYVIKAKSSGNKENTLGYGPPNYIVKD